MALVRIHYTKNNREIANDIDLVKRIMIRGNVDMQMIKIHYAVVHEFIHKLIINDMNKFLDEIFRRFNSTDNPLRDEASQARLKELDTHISMTIGSVIQIGDEYYAVAAVGFKKIIN